MYSDILISAFFHRDKLVLSRAISSTASIVPPHALGFSGAISPARGCGIGASPTTKVDRP